MSGILLSLGSINADFQMKVPSPLGDRETVAASALHRLGGGKAANVALLAKRMGCDVQLLGRVGTDDLADQALQPLEAAGVDTSCVIRSSRDGTAVSVIAVPPSGKKSIVLAGEANRGFSAEDVQHVVGRVGQAPGGSMLVVDYEVTPAAASQAIAAALDSGLQVVVDPSFPDDVDTAILRGVTALTPNRSEALMLAGMRADAAEDGALLEAARRLAAFGVRIVCIKLDDGGCLLVEEGRAWHQRAAAVRPVDTTGAGDAFTGAFALALLEGLSPRGAAEWGVVATELAVVNEGSQAGYRPRTEFMDRLHAVRRDFTAWEEEPSDEAPSDEAPSDEPPFNGAA